MAPGFTDPPMYIIVSESVGVKTICSWKHDKTILRSSNEAKENLSFFKRYWPDTSYKLYELVEVQEETTQ